MSLTTPLKNEQWNWVSMYKIPPDILDDLCSRFIVNVPEEERKDLVRLCFQIELAHWFYIDFYCSEENSTRKHCSFKEFSANIFKVNPLANYKRIFSDTLISQTAPIISPKISIKF